MSLSRVLLIYPFGNSDIAFNGEETFPRGENFRTHLEAVKPLLSEKNQASVKPLQLEGEPFPSGLDFTALPENQRKTQRSGKEFIIETVRFPILFDVLQGLSENMNPGARGELIFQPIVTDQSPSHPQDTIGILPLVETYVTLLNNQCFALAISCWSPWTIDVTASDYDAILAPYSRFYEQIHTTFAEFDGVYFSLATGTPAMSVAAGLIFASDPRVTFIYKPRGTSTLSRVSTFRERVRRETLQRLAHLLDRFDFQGALDVVEHPNNGFSPQEVNGTKALLQALTAWQNYDFQRAAEVLDSLADGSIESFRALCTCLAQETHTPDRRAEFWHTKIADTVMRLEIAVYRRDLPAVLYHFYNYNDVCLAWGLNAHFPSLDVMEPKEDEAIKSVWNRFKQRCPEINRELKAELGKFQLLFALAEMNQHTLGESFVPWFQTHERLRWFQDNYVDSKRHRLIHGSVQLQERLFDQIFQDRLQEWDGAQKVEQGQGPWLLLWLTYSSHRALPPAPSVDSVRECAARAWEILAKLVTRAPNPPGWLNWQAHLEKTEVQWHDFEQKLQRAFAQEVQRKQEQLNAAVNQWKQEILDDVNQLNQPHKWQMPANLTQANYQSPQWGHYMVQHFMKDDPQGHRLTIKKEILRCLHPCLDFTSEWGKRPEVNAGSLIGNYLSGQLKFQELFGKLYKLFSQSQPQSIEGKHPEARPPRRKATSKRSGGKLKNRARFTQWKKH